MSDPGLNWAEKSVLQARPAISRAACALVGCLLIVGCGGGGGSGTNPPVNPSASVQFSATALTLTGDTVRNVAMLPLLFRRRRRGESLFRFG